MLLSLLIGSAGGTVFYLLKMPLAWMLGAMLATTIAALAGAPVGFWSPLRSVMITVIATLLGSGFTPEVAERVGQWGLPAIVVVAFVLAISSLVFFYLARMGRFDRISCYFAATPGGLGIMTLVGEAHGGDPRVISLTQASRILVVVCSIPLYLRYVAGLSFEAPAQMSPAGAVAGPSELLILVGCAVVGAPLASRLRIPNAAFIGPFVLSAAAYFFGIVEGRPPLVLVWMAQLVIGSALGARFVGVGLVDLRRVLVVALGSGALMLGGAVAVSEIAAAPLGIGADALLLALAPGGLPEMTLMALALHTDTAFVSTMHVVRIILVVVAAPYLFRLLGWSEPP